MLKKLFWCTNQIHFIQKYKFYSIFSPNWSWNELVAIFKLILVVARACMHLAPVVKRILTIRYHATHQCSQSN
jgi:hypothetical protein